MSALEGRLVRKGDIEGRVMAVALGSPGDGAIGEDTHTGFWALIQTKDGTLKTILLDGAEVVPQREPRPVPLPIAPDGARR